jgi:hypothetical protein
MASIPATGESIAQAGTSAQEPLRYVIEAMPISDLKFNIRR